LLVSQDSHSSIHTINHSSNVLARFFLYLFIDVIIAYNPIKPLKYCLTYLILRSFSNIHDVLYL